MRAAWAYWFGLVLVAAAAHARPPNIILLVADDLGYGDLGVQGGRDLPTPHLDGLAAAGVRFTNAYSSGCVCSPSRVGVLTGRYQNRTGHDSNPHRQLGLDTGEVTLPQRLKAAGYRTGMVGKWHLGRQPEQRPLARGFDEFYGILEHGIGPAEKGNREIVVYRNDQATDPPDDYTTAFGREAIAFIERHKAQPFFLYVPFTAVHSPHLSPEGYQAKVAHIADPRRRRYLAMLAALDDTIGRITARLRELNLAESTLVVFMSDNGGPDGAPDNRPLRGGKWTLWEGGIRSPFFAVWKGRIAPGRVSDEPVMQIDIAATSLAAAGVAVPSEWKLDGVNLLPLLEGKQTTLGREALFWRFGPQLAVRHGQWKLVKPGQADPPMLFDLAADVGETKDLAAEHPQRAADLKKDWDAWNAGNIPPRWDDERWDGAAARKQRKEAKKASR